MSDEVKLNPNPEYGVLHDFHCKHNPCHCAKMPNLEVLRMIDDERTAGWPNIHPEDFCHRCGGVNPVWFVDNSLWATVEEDITKAYQGIVCPGCFAELHKITMGDCNSIWQFKLWDGNHPS